MTKRFALMGFRFCCALAAVVFFFIGIVSYYFRATVCPKAIDAILEIKCAGPGGFPLNDYIGYLPDLVHPAAFIMLGAAALDVSNKFQVLLLCLLWFSLELVFEFIQIPLVGEYLGLTKFYSGTFDLFDIGAYLFGVAISYGLLVNLLKLRRGAL